MHQFDSADPVGAGESVTYTINADNAGPLNATNVTLTDALPTGATFVSATASAGSCAHSAGVVSCDLGSIPAFSGETVEVVVTVPSSPGTIMNSAEVAAEEPDADLSNNKSDETTEVVVPAADLRVSQVDAPDPVGLGGNVTYTVTVANDGPSTAAGVTLVDTLPSGAAFVSSSDPASCSESSGVLTCDLGAIAAFDFAQVMITVSAPSAEATLINAASASATAPDDPDLGNNEDTETTAVREPSCQFSTLAANDDGSTDQVDLGFTANFFGTEYTTLYVNNNGNLTFTGPLSQFTPGQLVESGLPIIAPFWADVDTRGAGSALVTYGQTTSEGHAAFCVEWSGVGYFASHDDKLNDLQLLLVDRSDVAPGDFDMIFTYRQVEWETGDASGGVDGLGGSSARAGYSNGDPGDPSKSLELPGSGVNGGLLDSNPDTGLVHHSRISATPGVYVFPVRNGAPPEPTADLAVTKSDDADPVESGGTITYTIAVTNNGPDASTGTTLDDPLPAGTSFVSAASDTGDCVETAGTVSCDIGALDPGATATITVVVTAPVVSSNTDLTNTATTSADQADSIASNNSASETTTVAAPDAPTLTVNATDDTDDGACTVAHCSLREAINSANAQAGTDSISFDIPGSGPHTISPLSALPTITDPAIIDGTTQPGFSDCGSGVVIELEGSQAGTAYGLHISAGSSTIRGLAINRFVGPQRAGIRLSGAGSNLVECNLIGTDPSGTAALPNTWGVVIASSGDNQIGTSAQGNVVSGNAEIGIEIEGTAAATNNRVQGNLIGLDITGSVSLANGTGVSLFGPANVIGGSGAGEGNVIAGNSSYGVHLQSAGNVIAGNRIGTDADGLRSVPNFAGINVVSAGNAIGGASAGAGNLISGNQLDGIILRSTASGNTVEGNHIGLDATGEAGLANRYGVWIDRGGNNTVGGLAPGAGNVISGNANGVLIRGVGASSNAVVGNRIGTTADGTAPVGNSGFGVIIEDASGNQVGGSAPAESNLIAFNALGVVISGVDSIDNAILSNSITSNGGLGIDLLSGGSGVTPNDAGDADSGPNQLQNYPVLDSATSDGSTTTIAGSLNSTPDSTFLLQFFANAACDASGYGEGERLLGSDTLTTDAAGDVAFELSVAGASALGEAITATATDADGNTSEFSACAEVSEPVSTYDLDVTLAGAGSGNVSSDPAGIDCGSDCAETYPAGTAVTLTATPDPSSTFTGWSGDCSGTDPCQLSMDADHSLTASFAVDAATLTVNSIDDVDDGACTVSHCSLREAITSANAQTGSDTISFAIPGSGPHTISPLSGLPTIIDPVIIDGTTQPGFSDCGSGVLIELEGSQAGNVDGLRISAGSSTIRGLAINRYVAGGVNAGIRLSGAGGNLVECNLIGTDPSGTTALPNLYGILIIGSATNQIGTPGQGNLISGNSSGVYIGSAGNVVVGNRIGTDMDGLIPLPNYYGVEVTTCCSSIPGDSNHIGGALPGEGNLISGNRSIGVFISSASSNHSVSGNVVEGNVISGNGGGVTIAGAAAIDNAILSNSITGNLGLGIDLLTSSGGVTPNDPGDADSGPNQLQNYPVLDTATSDGSTTTIAGTLNSSPDSSFLLQFFANAACDDSGYGEGERLLGSDTVTTDASGDVAFELSLAGTGALGEAITATATDADGNTSEFSACAAVSQPVVTHDLDVSLAGAGAGSVSSDPAGIDCGADCAETYPAGTAVSLTATPEPGSTFTGWSGDCTGTGPCELSMDADHSVTATFTVVTHDLDVTLAGAGSGSVSSDPAGIDCSSDCSETYPDGTAVTLTAAPEPGSTFTGWSADCSGTASCELSMDADHSVTATFEVEPSADLGVTQTDEPDPVTGGNAVNYAITVTNNGPDAATGVILTDTLPAGHALVGVDDPSCTFASGVVTCPIGSLASGDSADVSITVATTAVSSPTAMINEARVSADQTDPVSSNDSAIAVTTVQPAPDDPDTASGWITAAGGTVETGGGNKPTKRDPMTTSVTVPPGYEGVVTIHEGPITTCPPSYGCFGQQADITAPSTSATAPLRITFSYHPSALPRRTHLQDIVMFHDGVLVGPCVDASGAAAPDPCISSVTRKKGAVRVVVLSSENGSWVGGRR